MKGIEHAPLLGPGFHKFSLAALRALCVFPGNARREGLFALLEELFFDLNQHQIRCELWVDGSLMTSKDDPDDLDVIIKLDYDVANSLTETQRVFIDILTEGEYKEKVDSFVFVSFPRGHEHFGTGLDDRDDWAKQYGLEASQHWCKGVALILVGETDVGLRIHP